MDTENVSLALEEELPQHDRLTGLLAGLEQEHGPIEPQVLEEVRQEWPAPRGPARRPLGK